MRPNTLAQVKFFKTSITLNLNNTTGDIAVANITGKIALVRYVALVTTAFSANITTAGLRITDGTTTVAIPTTATFSNYVVGSVIASSGGINASLFPVSISNTRFRILEAHPTAATTLVWRYTTTDAPSSGAMDIYFAYFPLDAKGHIY